MSKTLLNMMWHMHQPDYRDNSGVMVMPWVFLHSIKDYYDMVWLVKRFNIKATFNITPSLIEQIDLYCKFGSSKDRFLTLLKKRVENLTIDEKEWIYKICKSPQYDTMVKPFKRYKELYDKETLNNNQFLELEVIFLLAWSGNYLRRNSRLVSSLIEKERGFSEDDKVLLIDELIGFIPKILPFYGDLAKNGQISLSTTPLKHPITPLLIDINTAKISNPNTKIPSNHFSLIDDAKIHIKKALEIFKKRFGFLPKGFWPSEGAVDSKSLELYRDFGIKWIATDEVILQKSKSGAFLHRIYQFKDISIAFRDRRLSDKIGFEYKNLPHNIAVDDFILYLKETTSSTQNIVTTIVDGENAWEFYSNNGIDFFETLYDRLNRDDDFETITMDESLDVPKDTLSELHPGSWIYGTFDTWVGAKEKNIAWELLFDTKKCYLKSKKSLDSKTTSKIEKLFLQAEASDWFWWYGDDHYSQFSQDFDKLFREILITIHKLLNKTPPTSLLKPIKDIDCTKTSLSTIKSQINPNIDGKIGSIFKWLGARELDISKIYSTMDGDRGAIKKVYFGENRDNFFIRLEGDMNRVKNSLIKIHTSSKSFDIDSVNGIVGITCKVEEVFEISIKKSVLKHQPFRIEVLEVDRKRREIIPPFQEFDSVDHSLYWFI